MDARDVRVQWATSRWLLVPPCVLCPACGASWTHEPLPTRGAVDCDCAPHARHVTWTCPSCGAVVAEGCRDASRWREKPGPVRIAWD